MTRRMTLLMLAGLDLPCRSARRPFSSGLVAFHYGASFERSTVEWYARFSILVTGGILGQEQSRRLMDRGTRLVAYEWSSAFYPEDAISADLEWQTEVRKQASTWLLLSQPMGGGAAMPGRRALWYDFAEPKLRSARAAHLASRVRTNGYSGLFLDTLGFEHLPPELRAVFSARHPGADYNRQQAS